MKIISSNSCVPTTELRCIDEGQPFQTYSCLNQKHRADDIFIRNEVPNSYHPGRNGSYQYEGKIGVTNLRTGALAYVDPCREVIKVKAVVKFCS